MQQFFIKTKLAENMSAALPACIKAINSCQASLKENFPNVKRTSRTFWCLWQNKDVACMLAKQNLTEQLSAVGLSLDNDKTPEEQPQIFVFTPNMWRVMLPIAQITGWRGFFGIPGGIDPGASGNPIHHSISLIRSGALILDKEGNASAAEDAEERIKEFCTLKAENALEKEFMKTASKLVEDGEKNLVIQDDLQKLRIEFIDQMKRAKENASVYHAPIYSERIDRLKQECNWYRIEKPRPLRLMPNYGLPATEESMWAWFKEFIVPARKNDRPSAFNEVGIDLAKVPEIWEVTGYRPRFTTEVYALYPKVYADVKLTSQERHTVEQNLALQALADEQLAEKKEYLRKYY